MNRLLAISVVAAALTGCFRSSGVYIPIDEYKDLTVEGEYIIRPGDTLNIRVFQQEPMSARTRVRTDGKISLPFLNDVTAAGYSPVVLSQQLQTRLKDYINNPVVTISLEEVRPVQVSVLGEVPRPGVYGLETGSGVLQALASAGGFTPFAYKEVFVLRSENPAEAPKRLRFDYDALTLATGKGPLFKLKAGDVVVVE
jgi:polysaccharide export outer membrane protein